MGERIKIGVVYVVKESWIGGTYYIQNLISALSTLEDECQPHIVVFANSKEAYEELQSLTSYKHMEYRLYKAYFSIAERVVNYIGRLTGIGQLRLTAINRKDTDLRLVYPVNDSQLLVGRTRPLAWKPDFQEKHLPKLFSEPEFSRRDAICRGIVNQHIPCVFSSYDAENDFKTFYGTNEAQTFVVHFAVKHPDYSDERIDELKKKFSISSGRYFFCANQFWVHKNHLFLFEAFRKYVNKGHRDAQLICSGALKDFRHNTYSEKILSFIRDNNLQDNIRILGFISRTEQLCLMKKSYAVIQPSLFEGWSTVVEDAKAMNKFIFLSNLNVHKEQNPANVCFFDPHDVEDLANKLESVDVKEVEVDYSDSVRHFAAAFMSAINNVKEK